MAWEIWLDTHPERSYGQMGFFCNTTDHSFGPVFMTDSSFDKGDFYKMWEQAGFKDPRTDDDNISKHTRHILNLMSWDENVIATLTVSRADGINAPVPFFEKTIKESYDEYMGFSAFEKELEALPEDDFTQLEYMIDDANNDMRMLILQEDPHNDDKIVKTFQEDLRGSKLRVDIQWEVLDEY